MKYRVHTFQTIRVSYEVEADSPKEAKELVDEDGWKMEPSDVQPLKECSDWSGFFMVDTLNADGEVHYESTVHFDNEVSNV